MNTKLIFLFSFFLISLKSYSNGSVIVFKTDQEITVRVKRPISGMYNSLYVNAALSLFPHKEVCYLLSPGDYGSVSCEYSSGRKVEFYVFESDSVIVNYLDGKITFEGDNAAGNQYWNNGRIRDGWNFQQQIKGAINDALKQNEDLSIALNRVAHSPFSTETLAKIERMATDKLISEDFSTLLNNYMRSTLANTTLDELEIKSMTDSLGSEKLKRIDQLKDSIYLSLHVDDVLPIKFSSLYISSYYHRIYDKLDNMEKKLLLGKFAEETFGPYSHWLLSPPKVQYQMLFDVFLFTHYFKTKEISLLKLYEYLSENFPESEAMSIMLKFAVEEEQEKRIREKPVLIKEPIKSLHGLTNIKELKGQTLLIDLWATWCTPCRLQFRYLEDLHKLLNSYQNVTSIFISIDKREQEKVWESVVNEMSGFHLRASESLIKDIKEKVFDGKETMLIPRYILIDPTGKVINANLPRPDKPDELKLELDKYLTPKKK
ncbi:TlpA family protein disulfide reductase [Bacteroides faecium]|uniref:Redoxin family protein n=1 Tax=Bacteroides faecium TaxID=2715212 RepID=A0A6H0KK22_9BACE|nr:TlpA disulfide reductase family protein [Bacteroides faecium]QIU92707.1 redoxin family protein [Bacteroides faecium]